MKKALVVGLVLAVTLVAMAVSAQQAAAPAASGLTVSRMEIASDVQNREPVGVAASFPATQERVYCFMEFTDVAQETTVNVVWTLGMNEMARVPLTIRAYSKFRTWAYKTIAGMKGDWKVEIVDGAGTVLKSAAFKIE
ncbi:MAG: hypothetical protein A2X56_15450 [Nitrospirae bacterium GWC2_57_13]|jgi:hypothetical protein|nr:MAG: hypothetical protein A2072_01760 [Nitrospirae bacterium GWC1_57_7]OGW29185.1 MAG: hypothetical protein A2X56_15450 [Nitrospirae bacterium GWC2_57_13]OGW44597.1 MAG: hypothetical protein A2X57_12175 [Nitrospirae bacterium GWD2_57_8]